MIKITVAAVLLALLAIVSNMDYADAEAADQEYCANVRDHVWPAYRGRGSC